MHRWSAISGFDAPLRGYRITSACQCLTCGSRRMAWQDGDTAFHYASPSQYLGTQEPECVEAELTESVPFTLQSNTPMTTATIQLIEQRAQAMTGRTFVFKQDGTVHTICEYVLRNHRLIITSDQRRFNFEAKHALKLMEQFAEVPESESKSEADEIFAGVMAMAQGQGHDPEPDTEQPEPQAPNPLVFTRIPEDEPEAKSDDEDHGTISWFTPQGGFMDGPSVGYPTEVEAMAGVCESQPPASEPKAVASEGLVKAFEEFSEQVVEKAREMSIKDRPGASGHGNPLDLMKDLSPLISDYDKINTRLEEFKCRSKQPIAFGGHELDEDLSQRLFSQILNHEGIKRQDAKGRIDALLRDYLSAR
jgi:hypothetical protein